MQLKKLNILHLEDSASDAKLVSHILKQANLNFEMLVVDSKSGFVKALADYSPDLILADHDLPSFNSHEALDLFRDTGLKIPFILITGNVSEQFSVDLIKRGAHDYILKDRLQRLPSSIMNLLEKFRVEKERLMVVDSLIQNEKRYRELIENMNDAIVLIGRRLEFVYQSPSVYRLTGYLMQDRLGKKVFDFIHPDDLQEGMELFKLVSATPGISHHFQYRISHKKGHYIWIEGTLTNLLEEKSVQAIVVNYRDVTERKRSEEALSKSEFRYRQIVETAQEGIWLIDENNITTFVNKKLCDILGYSQEEMVGKENFYFLDEVGVKNSTKSLERRRKGIDENVILQFTTKSGRLIWAKVSANPVFDNEKNYRGALAMVSDITEKKSLETLLDKTNKLARIGNWEVNLIDNSIYWSPQIRMIHEVDEEFTPDLQTAINYYKAGESRKAITRVLQRAIESGVPWDLELQIVTAKKNERWMRVIGEAEFIEGKCVRVYGSFQDIDTNKSAEIEALKVYQEKNIILESISDAFFAVDKNWFVTYWNKEAERILKRPKEEILGNNLWAVYDDALNSDSFKYYHKAVHDNAAQHFETFYEPLNQSFEVSAYPSSTGLSVYFKDITEKKALEQELQKEQMNTQKEITKAVVFAQEKERIVIGEELHDNVNQLLAAAQLYLDHSLANGRDPEFIVKAQQYIATSMDEIRKLSHALVGPADNKMMGLVDALREFIKDLESLKLIKIKFRHSTSRKKRRKPV